MILSLETSIKFGIQTIFHRTTSSSEPWLPDIEDARGLIRLVDDLGYDPVWVGDHVA